MLKLGEKIKIFTNIKVIRDFKVFYVELRVSEGENSLEELLEVV